MGFVIRCLFWLGLVYLALPWSGEELRSDIATSVEEARKSAGAKARDYCAADPLACASHAAEAARLLGLAPPASPSQDTLLPADLKPRWRGPPARAAG